MSGRCVGCNKPFSNNEMQAKDKVTGDYETLCVRCRDASNSEYNFFYDHSYEQSDTTERSGSLENGGGYYYDFWD